MSRVFIPETPFRDVDISDLNRFGEVIALLDDVDYVSPHEPMDYIHLVLDELKRRKFNGRTDRIAIVGKVLASALFLACVVRQHESVKLLIYDSHMGCYVERVIDMATVISA